MPGIAEPCCFPSDLETSRWQGKIAAIGAFSGNVLVTIWMTFTFLNPVLDFSKMFSMAGIFTKVSAPNKTGLCSCAF
jgi:hypothetical protein